jgi:flagellar biosynthetic protein FlhB
MSDETSAGDKQYEPTQRKLDEARRKGELPRSTDLTGAAAYLGLAITAALLGYDTLGPMTESLAGLVSRAPQLAEAVFGPGSAGVGQTLALRLIPPIVPWFAISAVLALAALFAHRAVVFAPEKITPKLSRISLVQNAKNKFGLDGLFEFAKSATKLTIYSALLGVYLVSRLEFIIPAVDLPAKIAVIALFRETVRFIWLIVLIATAIAAVDLAWQVGSHHRKNRMTRKEVQDEAKDTEGDPYMKQQRRDRGMALASNRMLQDVPTADVVIVNPTRFAVALKWDRASPVAPVCVAKGAGEIAGRIRELAAEAGVPIHRDPPTARALYATVDIGSPIPPAQYRAVAAAIRFADLIRTKARTRR